MTRPSGGRSPRLLRRIVLALVVVAALVAGYAYFFDPEDVIFFPTYGFKTDAAAWEIPMRAKVQEPRYIAKHLREFLGALPARSGDEDSRFRARMADLVADDESGQDVVFRFDDDPGRTDYRIGDGSGSVPLSDGDGVVKGKITLSDTVAQRLLAAQRSSNGWLTYRATARGHTGVGRLRLIDQTGVSVISDIDDTIKITEVPAGNKVVVINTFYREFVPIADMVTRYRAFGNDVAFHYVSGGPWQLYRAVSSFLIDGKHFPEGSFHMKHLSGNIRAPISSLASLERFIDTEGTFNHKVEHITEIIKQFPGRKFVLIGDSGECDPDVYRKVRETEKIGAQVQEIIIRDLVNLRQKNPAKLEGMTVIDAPSGPFDSKCKHGA